MKIQNIAILLISLASIYGCSDSHTTPANQTEHNDAEKKKDDKGEKSQEKKGENTTT